MTVELGELITKNCEFEQKVDNINKLKNVKIDSLKEPKIEDKGSFYTFKIQILNQMLKLSLKAKKLTFKGKAWLKTSQKAKFINKSKTRKSDITYPPLN